MAPGTVPHKPPALMIQVLQAERRLLERRRSILACTARLRRTAHARMFSPAMLAGAAGVGFAFERMTARKRATQDASEQGGHAQTDFLGLALKLSSFVRSLSKFIP
jgi:hypothetical protein